MNSLTHTLGEGSFCSVCDIFIPMTEDQMLQWKPGNRIGLITSPHSEDVSYRVGVHDSNEPCSPAESEMSSGTSTTSKGGGVPNAA
jgi:hypothetical protein